MTESSSIFSGVFFASNINTFNTRPSKHLFLIREHKLINFYDGISTVKYPDTMEFLKSDETPVFYRRFTYARASAVYDDPH